MRKKCKRKHYLLINPVAFAIEGASYTPTELLDRLRIRELASLEAMAKGAGGLQEWTDLNAILNLCEYLANNGVGPEALESCEALQSDLIAAARRYEATKRMGMTATGIQAARDVLEYHQLQRQSIPRSDYDKAIKAVQDRIRSNSPEVIAL